VCHDDCKGSAAASKGTTVTTLGFDVANDGSLGDSVERKDVADCQNSLLSTVDELTGVHSLGTEEEFIVTLVTVGVEELDLGDGGSATGIMQNVLDDTPNVTVLFSIVVWTELDGTLARTNVGFEDGRLSLSLRLEFIQKKEEEDFHRSTCIIQSFGIAWDKRV